MVKIVHLRSLSCEHECVVVCTSLQVTYEFFVSFDDGKTGYPFSFRKEDVRNLLGFVKSLVNCVAINQFEILSPFEYVR